MTPSQAEFRKVTECNGRHESEQRRSRWTIGILVTLGVFSLGLLLSWMSGIQATAARAESANARQDAQIESQTRESERIFKKLDTIESLLRSGGR